MSKVDQVLRIEPATELLFKGNSNVEITNV